MKGIYSKLVSLIMCGLLTVNLIAPFTSYAASPNTDQYIFHSRFEGELDGWNGRGDATVLTSGRIPYKGAEALLVQERIASWNGAIKSIDSMAFIPGNEYSFSVCAIYLDGNPTETFYFKLQYTDGNDETQYSQIAAATAAKGEYVQLANTNYKIPSDATNMQIYVETAEGAVNFYIDEAIGAVKGTIIDGPGVPDIELPLTIGDVNNDGKIDKSDLKILKEYALGVTSELPRNQGGDLDGDGNLNAIDVLLLKNLILYPPQIPVEPDPIPDAKPTKVNNPIIWADVPDPSVIRVGDTYYMVSTTMYFTPGVPIMKSKDLVSWEIVNYVYDVLGTDNKSNLENGQNVYSKGSWAASLRYNNGTFYVFVASYDQGKSYVFQTEDIENGAWRRSEINGVYHDASLLFDDDGRVYIVYGGGAIRIKEMNEAVTGFKPGGIDQILFDSNTSNSDYILNAEGAHFYKINGMYYVFLIAWPKGSGRTEYCFRSDTLLGNYEGKVVLNSNGVAQGGIVDTPDGDWYAMLFQDFGAVGRIPNLVPVTWQNGWPMMGISGEVPRELTINTNYTGANLARSDEFDYEINKLMHEWQWNHNPDNNNWSLTERPGYLRLKTGRTSRNLMDARNTLTQRTEGPACSAEIKMDVSNMKSGDFAGLAAFQEKYGVVGIKVEDNGDKKIFMSVNGGEYNPQIIDETPLYGNTVYLKINFNFGTVDNGRITLSDKASFYYSMDGQNWIKIGNDLSMSYNLSFFTGYRSAIFNYATKTAGGYVDVDYFHYERTEWQEALK
ncbi:MAG: family 43 glycosylhydrolase [Clostridiales bacterium]|nr:family 43 glycosylhydrolase [Clostridiales bacterium]